MFKEDGFYTSPEAEKEQRKIEINALMPIEADEMMDKIGETAQKLGLENVVEIAEMNTVISKMRTGEYETADEARAAVKEIEKKTEHAWHAERRTEYERDGRILDQDEIMAQKIQHFQEMKLKVAIWEITQMLEAPHEREVVSLGSNGELASDRESKRTVDDWVEWVEKTLRTAGRAPEMFERSRRQQLERNAEYQRDPKPVFATELEAEAHREDGRMVVEEAREDLRQFDETNARTYRERYGVDMPIRDIDGDIPPKPTASVDQ